MYMILMFDFAFKEALWRNWIEFLVFPLFWLYNNDLLCEEKQKIM